VSAVGSLSLGLGSGPAAANSCSPGVCAVTNVNFVRPGNYSLPNSFCGIEGAYAPIGASDIDSEYDDEFGLGHGEEEGNYVDSEAVQFSPASTLAAGNTITVALPHPSLTAGGSVLPAAQVPAYTPEQTNSSVSVIASFPATTNPNNDEEIILEVNLGSSFGGDKVELDAFDPYRANPLTPVGHGGGDGTHASFVTSQSQTTNPSGQAFWFVTDSQQEEVVFAATDTTQGEGIVPTATFDFNGDNTSTTAGGGPSTGQLGEQCAQALTSPASTQSGYGSTYMLIDANGNAHFLQTVSNPTDASGEETVTLTVPGGFPEDTNNSQITLDVLDAVAPPGIGTPQNSASASDQYPASDFSVATSEDPVPGYPNNAPTFQADYSNKLPFYPVDEFKSTLTTSATTAQVSSSGGPTATVTLNDFFVNPVNDKQVSIFPVLPTHASVAPQGSPPSGKTYPTTGDNGMVSYSVSDYCAEKVNLQAIDVDDQTPIEGSGSPSITFTAGPPVAPDAATANPPCGSVASSVKTSTPFTGPTSGAPVDVPADGATKATVNVTLADQFGNIDSCQLVALTPNTQNAVVQPQVPAHPCAAPENGPGYSGTDGVATFTVTDSHVENVTLGVIDEGSSALWPSNATTNAPDVAQVDFLGADAGQSTVTPPTQNSPANGTAQVTVTLNDRDGTPLSKANQVISLAGCTAACTGSNADPTTTIAAHTGFTPDGTDQVLTNSSGQAVFDVTDNSTNLPHTVYYQATDVTDGVVITGEAQVTFTMGGATFTASPATVVADGVGTSTLTFTLSNTTPSAVSGASVVVTTPSSTAAISPVGGTSTNGSGQALFTVSDTKAETPVFTATATFSSSQSACPSVYAAGMCTVKVSTTATFISPPTTLTAVASPGTVPADGVSTSQVTVTAMAGATPVSGLEVEVVPSGSPAATAVFTPADAVTGSNGQATIAVTDTVAGAVTLTPEYSDALSTTFLSCQGACTVGTGSVTFTETEGEASTITATTAGAPADGVSTVCVTVTLQSSAAIAGHAVSLVTGSATTNVTPYRTAGCTGANVGAVTNASGQVFFTVTDTTPEPLLLYARDLYTGVIIGESTPLLVTFTETEAQASTVVASPTPLPAGGPTSTITVILQNGAGTPFVGDLVKLSASSSTVSLPVAAATNTNGVVTFKISDSAVETVTITAVDKTKGVTLLQTASVEFTSTEAQQSSVTINPITTPADGPAATLTVVARNGLGQPLAGEAIVVKGATTTTTVTPLLTGGLTNSLGVAQFSVSDTAIETETLSACDTTVSATCTQASGALLSQTATIAFSASEANESGMTSLLSTLPAFASGCTIPALPTWICPTTTVTVTLRNAGGAVVAGHVVSLSSTSKTVLISPVTATTNSLGEATFTIGDSVVESGVVFTALDRTTGSVVVKTVSVSFTANEANQSTITGTPNSGAAIWTITVTLLDQNDHPLVGKRVTLTTGSPYTYVTTLTKGLVTNAAGQIQFQVQDTMTQVLSVTATDNTAVPIVTLYKPLSVSIYR
jgi:adhesin/invasin